MSTSTAARRADSDWSTAQTWRKKKTVPAIRKTARQIKKRDTGFHTVFSLTISRVAQSNAQAIKNLHAANDAAAFPFCSSHCPMLIRRREFLSRASSRSEERRVRK